MEIITIKNNSLRLPEDIAKKLRGMQIEISELKEGILLKAVKNPIDEARGFLKGKQFTSKRYLEMKRVEKDLEL